MICSINLVWHLTLLSSKCKLFVESLFFFAVWLGEMIEMVELIWLVVELIFCNKSFGLEISRCEISSGDIQSAVV